MGKPFYSLDEVRDILNKNVNAIRDLVRDGTLREFRDAGKVFYKGEDVDKLAGGGASDKSGTGEIVLEKADEEDELPSLADSGGGTSVIGLEAVDDESDEKEKEDTVITASGIGVFDDDELEIDADPMAKTQITTGATADQISLEGSGGGSGLLDLTREADDTSLGAELLDEIYPGEDDATESVDAEPPAEAAATKPDAEEEADAALESAEAGAIVLPVSVAAGDPSEGVFSGLLVGSLILLGLSGAVAASVLQGYLPDYAAYLSDRFLIVFLPGAAGVVLVSLLVGWFLGKALATRRR